MPLTCVMYHYVREVSDSAFPQLKALEFDGFKRQLDHFQENYTFVGVDDLVGAANESGRELPENAILLTFDDGYRDHYSYVYPELKKRGIEGIFFPPVLAVEQHMMLDVNQIQFILERNTDPNVLLAELRDVVIRHGMSSTEFQSVYDRVAISSRYDGEEIVFFKRFLQREAPEELRLAVLAELFEIHIGQSPASFARDLYLTPAQISEMYQGGMRFGSHGYSHCWLGYQEPETQEFELRESVKFLKRLRVFDKDWVMCYPYGSYNAATFEILQSLNCAVGLVATPGYSDFGAQHRFAIKRFDTIDFPH